MCANTPKREHSCLLRGVAIFAASVMLAMNLNAADECLLKGDSK